MTFPIFKFVIILINCILLSFVIILLIEHSRANHKTNSWASIFHLTSLIWLIMRVVFWLKTILAADQWEAFTFYILYWIPNPIEFGSFMLLPLFYWQILYPSEWGKHLQMIKFVYIAVIIGMISFQIVWSLLSAYEESKQETCMKILRVIQSVKGSPVNIDCYGTDYSSNVFRGVTVISFLLLACIQGIYAYHVHFLDAAQYDRYMPSSKQVLAWVNVTLVLSFLSRAVYQSIAIAGVYHLPNIPLQGSADVQLMILICFFFWDYLPVFLLISTITSRVMGSRNNQHGNLLDTLRHYLPTFRARSGDRRYRSRDNIRRNSYGAINTEEEIEPPSDLSPFRQFSRSDKTAPRDHSSRSLTLSPSPSPSSRDNSNSLRNPVYMSEDDEDTDPFQKFLVQPLSMGKHSYSDEGSFDKFLAVEEGALQSLQSQLHSDSYPNDAADQAGSYSAGKLSGNPGLFHYRKKRSGSVSSDRSGMATSFVGTSSPINLRGGVHIMSPVVETEMAVISPERQQPISGGLNRENSSSNVFEMASTDALDDRIVPSHSGYNSIATTLFTDANRVDDDLVSLDIAEDVVSFDPNEFARNGAANPAPYATTSTPVTHGSPSYM